MWDDGLGCPTGTCPAPWCHPRPSQGLVMGLLLSSLLQALLVAGRGHWVSAIVTSSLRFALCSLCTARLCGHWAIPLPEHSKEEKGPKPMRSGSAGMALVTAAVCV